MVSIARDMISATDEEIEEAFSEVAQIGLTVDNLCFGDLAEIDAFRSARSGWSSPGNIETDDETGFHVSRAAARKGQSRRDIVLIPFGEFCAIYGVDR